MSEMKKKIYETGEDFEPDCKVLFGLFDADKDGSISRAEGIAGFLAYGGDSDPAEYDGIFTAMGPNSDDLLTYEAFVAFWRSQK